MRRAQAGVSVRNRSAIRGRKRACIFSGPSLGGHTVPDGIDVYPPATRGAVAAAVKAGYTRIGLVDGALDDGERVPLSELRGALSTPGLQLVGGGSTGAIRAVQLEAAGMTGIGRVYRLFRRRSLSDSDEVYVLHAPAALRYRCLTLPLVNLRYTFRAMRQAQMIAMTEERALIGFMRDVPWFDRDRCSLSAAVYSACGSARSAGVMQAFDRLYRDVKREDGLAVATLLMRA